MSKQSSPARRLAKQSPGREKELAHGISRKEKPDTFNSLLFIFSHRFLNQIQCSVLSPVRPAQRSIVSHGIC